MNAALPAMPTFGLRFPPCAPVTEVADAVRRSELVGFDTAWIADSQLLWRDVFAAMAVTATKTERIRLITAVSNFVTRHPSVLASAANTIQELAPGRFTLGVGSGDSSVKLLDMRPSRLGETRAAVTLVRSLLDGEMLEFGPRHSRLKDAHGAVPILLAASGPKTLQLAGEIADAVLTLAGIAPEMLTDIRGEVEHGAAQAGRSFDDVEFIVGTFCRVTDDIERDARVLKPMVLHMASTGSEAYLDLAGIELAAPPAVPEVYPDMVHAEVWEEAVEIASNYVSDEMAVKFSQTFCLFGTVDQIVQKLKDAVAVGATGFYLRHIGNYTLPDELIESVGDILPKLRTELAA